MASKTRATELKRMRRDKNQGKKRKSATNTKGSTQSQKDLFQD